MKLIAHNRSIFEITEADTIVLPVDGSGPNLEGGVARQFMRLVGVERVAQLLAPPPYYPFDGEPAWGHIAGLFDTHFEWVCCIDSLSHKEGADHRANLRRTIHLMFDGMSSGGVGRRVACTILTGGKRVAPVDAIHIMVAEADKFSKEDWEMHIAETDKARFELLKSIVG